MELVLIAGALVAAYLFMRSSAPAAVLPPSPVAQNIVRSIPVMQPPAFGVAMESNVHTCTPSQSTVPLVAPSIADSTVGGVDLFAASGGITPDAAGDVLIGSFTGTDGVVQYQYRRPNGDTYTTTVKNP